MKTLAPTLVAALSILTAASALAQDAPPAPVSCTQDADCPSDQFCMLPACSTCDPDSPDCEPTDCGIGVCSTLDQPPLAECTSDAECTDGEICIISTAESCSGSGCSCPSDGDGDPSNDVPCDCPPPTEPECTTETYSMCGPRWLAECTVDEECGPGFTCAQFQDCACTIDSEGNESCDCADAPTYGSCQLVRVECQNDSDCSDGFVCTDEATSAPCFADDNGTSSCETPEASKVCTPPGYISPPAPTNGSEREEEASSEDDSDQDGDGAQGGDADTDPVDTPFFGCSQASAPGLMPLAGLALLVMRRRRR